MQPPARLICRLIDFPEAEGSRQPSTGKHGTRYIQHTKLCSILPQTRHERSYPAASSLCFTG